MRCPTCHRFSVRTNGEAGRECALGHRWTHPYRPGTDIARTTDPETSKLAAERITVTGARASQKARILEAVTHHPGRIRAEVAEITGMTEYQVSKRVSDLVSGGDVVYGTARDGQQTIWLPETSAPLPGQERLL